MTVHQTAEVHHPGRHGDSGGLPSALPSAAPNRGQPPLVSAPEDRNAGGKAAHPVIPSLVPATTGDARTPGARRRPGRGPGLVGLSGLLTRLSERDQFVLRLVHDHKFLTTRHIQALAFSGHASELSAARTSRRVLQRLHRDRLLVSLPRRVGGVYGGAEHGTWHLSPTGYRLRHLAAGSTDDPAPLRIREPSIRTVRHCLAVAEARVAAVQTAKEAADLSIVVVVTEPDTWRRYPGPMGMAETLKPDLELVTRTSDDHGQYEDRWFLEIDLATEHPPTVLRQCQRYEAYRRTGEEQLQAGVFPLVVWVVPDEARADKLRRAIRAGRGLDSGLFRVVTAERLPDLIRSGQGGEL